MNSILIKGPFTEAAKILENVEIEIFSIQIFCFLIINLHNLMEHRIFQIRPPTYTNHNSRIFNLSTGLIGLIISQGTLEGANSRGCSSNGRALA